VCEARHVRRPLPVTALTLLLLAAGCGGGDSAGQSSESPAGRAKLAASERRLEHESPPPLARIYAERGRILPGGLSAFRARLGALRGYPVVVNKWASWCSPCRTELPFFRRQALIRGQRIAFLGSNTQDTPSAARRFLADVAMPYPSYEDHDGELARFFEGAIAFPSTAFYDRHGRLATVKQGVYASERELAADIARYAR
jgi:cytochrome c biogenesis protein CcmG, thiol:disulfide interchange protein DsbE